MMDIFIMLDVLSQTIRQARRAQGLTEQQLADLCGLDRTTIGALERNNYSDLGIRKVETILNILGKELCSRDKSLPTLDELREIYG
jgi:transcriptional regulator with XRE-family HTH domain